MNIRFIIIIILSSLLFVSCTNKKEKAYDAMDAGKKKFYANDLNGAVKDFTKALEQNPGFDQALFFRANTFYNLRKNDSALADYNKCIEVSPDFADAYANRGSLKFDQGDRDGACLDWHKAKELGNQQMGERLQNCP